MPKKRKDQNPVGKEGLSRRDFVATGAAAGIGAAAMLDGESARAQGASTGAGELEWHYDVDVIVAGGGCAGLTAAIRARDLGASVLVVDQNFDVGGRMIHSGSFVSLGGGDPLQLRDMRGESDKEGFVTANVLEDPEELDDNVELLFDDLTDWSITDNRGQNPYRYNEREMVRAWAENCYATREFLTDNYVRFGRINGTHVGGGMSRARGATAFLMLGDVTDIPAGTVSREDAGAVDRERSSAFAPVTMPNSARTVAP
ncbi:MAG TPA: FAD-binding protein, partial [Gammaproteobacteria bacterium]